MASKTSYLIRVWQLPKNGQIQLGNKNKIIEKTAAPDNRPPQILPELKTKGYPLTKNGPEN